MNNTKFKSVTYLIIASVVLVGFSGSRCFASLEDWTSWADMKYEGELTINDIVIETTTYGNPGLDADGNWDDPGTKLLWSVEAMDPDMDGNINHFRYTYTFSDPDPSGSGTLSHIDFEVSTAGGDLDPFDLDNPMDFFDPTIEPYEVGYHEGIYSIKWEDTTDGDWTVSFSSMRVPEWGDFYAKDGAPALYAKNTGFGLDPSLYNEGDLGFIARPDTEYVPVPASVIIGLLGMGVAGIKLRKFA